MDMAKVGGPLSVVQVFTQIWTCQVHSLRLFSLQLILSAAHIWHKHALIGGIPTPLKNMTSSVGITIPNMGK